MNKILNRLLSGQILNEIEAASALQMVLSGDVPQSQTSAFLTAIAQRGLSLSELRGFHGVLRAQGKSVDLGAVDTIDVCGTGGDGKNTFNISTLTAFVLAGANIKVAKHGNASATSGCGSSDVLQFLGVKFTNDETVLRRQLERANICYLHAPLFQPALKNLAGLRREIGFRTFFNLLGVLLNPARPKFQLIGVAEPFAMRLYQYFLEDSAIRFALVHSRDGYDEISLTGAFDVITNYSANSFYPEDLNLRAVAPELLDGGATIEQAAELFLNVLRGDGTVQQNFVVIVNAAFAMRLVNSAFSFEQCSERAAESLLSGAALNSFERLVESSKPEN